MMDESFPLDNGPDMTNHQDSCTHTPAEKTTNPVVTTAEASSEESTTADSPEQPQAVTIASQSKASLSTVHVQQSFHGHRTSIPVVSHSASEPHYHKRKTLVRSPAVTSVPSPPPSQCPDETTEGTLPYKNTSFDSSDSGIAGELPPRLEAQARASRQSSLSRDGSFEYTDSTGTDLHEFIIKTLRNLRDRKFLMRLEQDLLNFIQEPALYIQYPPMTSYHRMIVHRVAAYFGMDHNVDQQTGKSVIINKTMNTRIPESRFLELLPREESEDSESAVPRLILRRQNTPDDSTPPKIESPVLIHNSLEDKRSKSIEEREEEYHKVRERIFNQDSLSSQSSHSSKGDADVLAPQLLQRDDNDIEDIEDISEEQKDSEWKSSRKISKSKSLDGDGQADKPAGTLSGIRIMTNKPLLRSSSSPGIVSMTGSPAVERVSSSIHRGSAGSPQGSHCHVPSSQTVMSAMPYWTAEGVPLVAHNLPSGELQMVPVHSTAPGIQGMVPVMAPSQSGGMMWSLPRDHGVMLINPNTGTPVLGADGSPLVMQPAYQQVMLKPGSASSYTQQAAAQPQVQGPQQPAGLGLQPQQQQQQQSAPGQIVMPQYFGLPQQVYMMPPSGRPPYAQQPPPQPQTGAEGIPGSQWSATGQSVTPTNPGYQEIAAQFGALSLSGQQASLDSTSFQQQQHFPESVVQGSTRTSSPMHVNTVTQPGVTGQGVPYVLLPHQMRQVVQGQTLVGQAVPQGTSPQQYQGYMVAAGQAPYQQYPYGAIPKDVTSSVIQHHTRSQTPPTPPQTASPILSGQFVQQQQQQTQQHLSFSPQIPPQSSITHPQQTHTPPYQQPTQQPHAQPQVMRPVVPAVVFPGRGIAMGHQGPVPPQYQQPPVHVHTQYPTNQKRVANVDRRVPKAGELYSQDGVLPGSYPLAAFGDGTFPVGYEIQGERSQYTQYQQQRFVGGAAMAIANSSGPQYSMYNKPKSKQYKERRGSPRPQHQDTSKKPGRKTPESENKVNHILEVYDLPKGIKHSEADELFEDLKKAGARIKRLNASPSSQDSLVLAIFSSSSAADRALNSMTHQKYKLRLPQNTSTFAHAESNVSILSSS